MLSTGIFFIVVSCGGACVSHPATFSGSLRLKNLTVILGRMEQELVHKMASGCAVFLCVTCQQAGRVGCSGAGLMCGCSGVVEEAASSVGVIAGVGWAGSSSAVMSEDTFATPSDQSATVAVVGLGAVDCVSSPSTEMLTVQILPQCPTKPSKSGRQLTFGGPARASLSMGGPQ